jgi:hypothetical protein
MTKSGFLTRGVGLPRTDGFEKLGQSPSLQLGRPQQFQYLQQPQSVSIQGTTRMEHIN